MKTMTVKLSRKWSDFEEGDIVIVPRAKGLSMIAKGYGEETRTKADAEIAVLTGPGLGPPPRRPEVETATAEPADEPAAETAEVTPVTGGRRGRRDKSAEKGEGD